MSCLILLSRTIGGVFVDAVLSETHRSEMEIAEHPVERGAKISDHAWRKPRELEMRCVVDGARALSAYEDLLRLQERAEPFTIVTGLKVYADMLVRGIEAERDEEHARILYFTASLREVIIVSTQGGTGEGAAGGGSGSDRDADANGKDGTARTVNRGQVQARRVDPTPGQVERMFGNARAAE